MANTFHQYIHHLLKEMDLASCDQQDVYDELMTHLELSKQDFISKGLNENKAEEKAMEQFGHPQAVGEEMQEAMFPGRKLLLLLLAYGSIMYSFLAYSSLLFLEGQAFFIWLPISVLLGVSIWFIAHHSSPFLRRRFIRVTIHLFHLLTSVYGAMILSSLDHWLHYFAIVGWLLAMLTVIALYQLVIYDYRHEDEKQSKKIIIIHVLNVTLGLLYGGFFLFFLWGAFAFSEGILMLTQWRFYSFSATLLVWIASYYVQIKYNNKGNWIYVLFFAPIVYIAIMINL